MIEGTGDDGGQVVRGRELRGSRSRMRSHLARGQQHVAARAAGKLHLVNSFPSRCFLSL